MRQHAGSKDWLRLDVFNPFGSRSSRHIGQLQVTSVYPVLHCSLEPKKTRTSQMKSNGTRISSKAVIPMQSLVDSEVVESTGGKALLTCMRMHGTEVQTYGNHFGTVDPNNK